MIRKLMALGMIVISCAVTLSCSKDDEPDEEFAPIIGVWQGTSIDYKFTPDGLGLGYEDTEEDFDGIVEFKEDGTVVYTDDGNESTGTYTITGDKLTTTVEFTSSLPFSAGTFTIKRLTGSKLDLYFEDEGEFDVPDFGTVSGELEATAFFERQ
jgi:uncharacterized protein (TIGR03066 family)